MSKEIRLGAFIFGTLCVLAAGTFLIGNKELLFSHTYRLKAQFQNVGGLYDGGDVRVGGIHKGTVKAIELPKRPDGQVTVVMDLASATKDIVRKDSVAQIKSDGLLGDKYVEVSFGSPDAEPVKGGDTIAGAPTLDIADVVAKTNQLLDTTKTAMGNIVDTSGDLKSITSKIDRGQGSVGALVNDKQLYERVNAGATAFSEDMEALKHNFLLRGFFRNRGYEDATELAKYRIARLPAGDPQKTFTADPRKLFDKPDSAKLKNSKLLDEAGKYLEGSEFGLAVVDVSTGLKGDAEKNRTLTEARAAVVRDYLVNRFQFNDTRLKTRGEGETPAGDKIEVRVYTAPVTAQTGTTRASSSAPLQ